MPHYFITLFNAAIVVLSAALIATPAAAVDGVVLITHANAGAGNVTPGDAPGYPVTISRTGSYRLAGNLQVPANRNGIEVNATEVSIDLNGFRMDGAGVAITGIVGYQRSLTVRNGTIRAFKRDGIYTRGALLIVEDMRILENRENGVETVSANSVSARILNSTIFGNAHNGIVCSQSCHVEGNIISNNGTYGFTHAGVRFDASGTALGNTIVSNVGYGINFAGPGPTGVGNNTIVNNTVSPWIGYSFISLHPNACYPTAC